MFDWQMVRGVTQLCQHLQGYSLRGIRKRDYPPSLFYQQPRWARYRVFSDAVSRIGMLLAEGDADFQLLVMHPQSSAWLHYDNADNQEIHRLFGEFLKVTEILESNHVPFHYGDERILSRHGRVEMNQLLVGEVAYRAVVVPPAHTLTASTVALLSEFVANGGQLIWLGDKPTLVAGEPNLAIDTLVAQGASVAAPGEILSYLPPCCTQIRVRGSDGQPVPAITATRRSLREDIAGVACRFYYFANQDQDNDYSVQIVLPGQSVRLFCSEDGSLHEIPFSLQNGEITVEQTIFRRGSLAIFVADTINAFPASEPVEDLSFAMPLEPRHVSGKWDLTLSGISVCRPEGK